MVRQGAAATGRYRMKTEGQSSQRGLQGMYVLNDSAGCQIYRPTWQGTRTIFRPFPGKDPEDPEQWDPFRLSDEEGDFGDWIRRYDMAFSFGNPGITFILRDPRDHTVDVQQNPVWMLYRAITQAVKSGQGHPSWNPLVFGGAGRGAPISAPKDGYIMQGILMEHKSVPQNPPRGCAMEHQPVVLLMSQSAGKTLIDKLAEKAETGTYRWPDLTDLNGGMFVQFHQAGTQHAAGGQGVSMTSGVGGGPAENNRYEVEFLEQYGGGVSPTFPAIHEVARAHVKSWDDIVRIPSVEEQIRLLCNAGIPATAIVYALGDVYRDIIPQHIFDQANAQRTQDATPFGGSSPPTGGDQNPMQPTGDPNPMASGAAPTQDPGMPTQTQPVSADEAGPAQAGMDMAADATPPSEAPVDQGFDPPPTHAAPERSQATKDALAAARARASGGDQG